MKITKAITLNGVAVEIPTDDDYEYQYGFKFLDTRGRTKYNDTYTRYPIPRYGGWSDWFDHASPAEPDGRDCGPGRWHVMQILSAEYAPMPWVLYLARWRDADVVGASGEKVGVRSLQLLEVDDPLLWEWLRLGMGSYADLRAADLRGAYLSGADLSGANLYGAIGHTPND